ncbi:MAG: bifunctional (p)ppGpp synthetase/guanosine-3',5'-bis(diphosphate) 3'-pyrophosphohydrolase [Bacteroidales bacterium]|nr:bifunctional (p)ppGpp synthetase/guanosine-3',5'-bis(diphosphate) 3'-pyrophosphohydrolase [Candidatus Cacconaster equi]
MMFTEEDYKLIEKEFDGLRVASKRRCADEEQYQLVLKAFDFANEAHNGVRRRSGEPYILHPIAVAKIVVDEIGLGCKSICAALLHDVVEDTDYTVEDIQRLFGEKIASLVDGLTKIKIALDDNSHTVSSLQAENFKRILLTLNDDVRIVLIKLADRLHNLRTIQFMPEYKRDKILSETMYIFIPLAHRLGLYSIKSEMENIWLQYREPEAYKAISDKLNSVMLERGESIDNFIEPVKADLDKAGYKYTILKRLKTPYSIWKKMYTKNIPFEEIFDIYAVRIIFEARPEFSEREQCWYIFSMITNLYQYKPDRTRDWVKEPKSNGYEALHVTVMGPGGNWIEVQIRSERMNSIAERGVAAHWLYKKENTGEAAENDTEIDRWLKQVREILENPDANALQFLDDIHKELVNSDIYVFTPKGKQIKLPKGSTALDFAYEIHTEVGHHAIAAKVSQKLQPLSYVLKNGDQVEIITSENGSPKREWLSFLRTSRAKDMVTDAIKDSSRDNCKVGMEILRQKLEERGITIQSRVLKKLIAYYNIIGGKEALYTKIGIGIIDLSDLDKALKTNEERRNVQMWGVKLLNPLRNIGKIDKKQDYILEEDIDDGTISFNIAECCSPIPGDSVVGFVDENGCVTIHKKSCPVATNLESTEGHRIVSVKWSKNFKMSYLTRISINGIDRMGILNDITRTISLLLNVNIRKLLIETHDEIFEGTIDLYVHNTEDLDRLIKTLGKIKGVESVKRIELK